jgi:hypothetical protein
MNGGGKMAALPRLAGPLCLLLAGAGAPLAQTVPATPPAAAPAEAAAVVFVPPAAGAPASRIGAGTRTAAPAGGRATLIVPAGGGLTAQGRPLLVWHLAEAFDGEMRVEVRDLAPDGRVLGRTAEGRIRAGFHALDLGRSEVELEAGHIYRWSVLLVEPGSGRVADRAEALVERVAPPPGTAGDLRSLAAAGLWFDALATVFAPTLAGPARLTDPEGLARLAASAGVMLPGPPAAGGD